MRFTVITIFPQLIEDYFKEGLLSKALKSRKIQLKTINPRQFTKDRHQTVDDMPYGGGAGLVMKIEPLAKAIQSVTLRQARGSKIMRRIILLDARGKRFTQKEARRLAKYDQLVFICGRYEGIDERIKYYIDEKISIGDFVLMGGELATLAIIEAVARLKKGVLGNVESAQDESFSQESYLEYPQYTRPEVFEGHKVPKVLLSGHHQKVKKWRARQSRAKS
jgi:tRNA (guanine37-N1)-methyltransferase